MSDWVIVSLAILFVFLVIVILHQVFRNKTEQLIIREKAKPENIRALSEYVSTSNRTFFPFVKSLLDRFPKKKG